MDARIKGWSVLAATAALGCADGPSDETVVDELRVLAIQAEPPEAAPGEDVELGATIANPTGASAEVLLWHCTDLGTGCLEDSGTSSWSQQLDGDAVSATATVPQALAAFATDEPLRATLVWALACEPGLCPQIGEPEAWDLSDPGSWLGDLPMSGVSLAFNAMAISTRDDRLENPVVELSSAEPIAAAPGELVALDFAVQLDVTASADTLAFGYGTAGGFGDTEYAIGDDGAVTLEWYAPDQVGEVTLYVVVNDGEGGVGIWVGQATVG